MLLHHVGKGIPKPFARRIKLMPLPLPREATARFSTFPWKQPPWTLGTLSGCRLCGIATLLVVTLFLEGAFASETTYMNSGRRRQDFLRRVSHVLPPFVSTTEYAVEMKRDGGIDGRRV